VGDDTLTVPRHGGVRIGPSRLRQVFNDTESDVLWLIVGAPKVKDGTTQGGRGNFLQFAGRCSKVGP